MPNQLAIPFKQTSPAQIKDAVQSYIEFNHTDAHPDAFKWDISRWEELRKDGVGGYVHVNRVDATLLYHAHLVLLLTKFPANIGLTITYDPAFPSLTRRPCSVEDLTFERACVLFNLAALHSQLGTAAGRNTTEGIKIVAAHFQNAAGVLRYLSKEVIPALASSLGQVTPMPSELPEPSLKSLEYLMLAQAQECYWQKASMENYKDGTLAKLAKQVALYYESAVSAVASVSPSPFSQEWINHLTLKKHHFEGVAQYRQSRNDLLSRKYGVELSRLRLAQNEVKQGLERSSKGVAKAVVDDVKSLFKALETNFSRAQQDNDLIYHQNTPPESTLEPIVGVNMVNSMIDNKLKDPSLVIGNTDNALFAGLVSHGVRMAIEVYIDRRDNWIKEEIEGTAKQMDTEVTRLLQKLNLPSSLDALDKPAGLPPSLLRRSEEIRSMGGTDALQALIDEVQTLGGSASAILEEAFDILDNEASEDETFFTQLPEDGAQIATQAGYFASHIANKDLTAKANSYRQILDNAASSDATVRGKWEEWEENVTVLCSDQEEMERMVPSHATSQSTESTQAHTYARAIRAALEDLDDLRNTRARCIESVRQRASTDDIKPRIVREATGLARWVEVKPAMFESTMEEELGKFDRYKESVEEGRAKQEELLTKIEQLDELLIQARTNDPVLKQREAALQSLDLAYHRYLEVLSNVTEGAKFYTDFSAHLNAFEEECTRWSELRHQQRNEIIELLSQLAQARPTTKKSKPKPRANARDKEDTTPCQTNSTTQSPQTPSTQPELEIVEQSRPETPMQLTSPTTTLPPPVTLPPPPAATLSTPKGFALPAPNSTEWETVDLPPPPSARKPARPQNMADESTPRRKTRSKPTVE
ncbi:pH-response regulator protein palA/RIM20 [Cryptococcus neoformans var, neoformans B-3501A] [Rhizoctonia solani]|uniref:pH-response regulator protein palA/RIM20 [Cryptococcus neoformans var, neoformans B-3501A] n=1 Tax=Rhizoctonia solani TaxID=456999 RepID=A0A0K6G4Y5_9AGAM|nr:pH-response regulator protein palA/RIM20 [Cryptococcus neoformans var, neoformans B-3501A] [Rhizoctonia solani]